MNWRLVPEDTKVGICVYNYLIQEDCHVPAYIGDKLHIFEECDDWFFVSLARNTGLRGIIPKSYVLVRKEESSGVDQGSAAVVAESTAMLREWGRMLRDIYVRRETKLFQSVQQFSDIISEQIGIRASLICGKLPREEVRDLRSKLTKKMDYLNHHLQLDLVVRDTDGNILDPDKTSAVSLFREHKLSSDNRSRNLLHSNSSRSNSYMLLLSVKNFTWKRTEDMELYISVYTTGGSTQEQKAPRPLCENYVIKWTRQGMARDIDQLNNFKVVFTDLSREDVNGSEGRVWLVCNVVGDGNYQALASEFQINKSFSKTDISVKNGLSFRKPLGVAATEITDYFNQTNKNIDGGDKEFMIPFLPSSSDAETLENTFRKLTNEKRERDVARTGPGLWVSLKVLQGDMTSMREGSKSHLVVGRPTIARKIGFPELILPNDVRNDLYVNIYSGELSRLNKTADRNIEVVVEAVDDTGAVLTDAVSGGASAELGREFSSVVYYHEGKPRWNEVIRVLVPVELYHQVHLRFTFKHRSRNEAKDKLGPAPWALAYLKLVNESNGTTVKDGYHDLLVYKIEKKFDMNNPTYLDLPSLKTNNSSHKNKLLQYSNSLSLITKDVLCVHTTLCSTKLTQNLGLLSLLKWRSEPDKLKQNLSVFTREVKAAEVVKFLPDVLDALFSILMENSDSELYDNLVFEALVAVIEMVTEDKFKQFVPVLEVYINENFSATLAYNKLLVVFKDYVEAATGHRESMPMSSVEQRRKCEKLGQAMNSLQFLLKFVVRSRFLFSNLNGGKGAEPFEAMLREVLLSLVKLMFASQQELLTVQASCLKHLVMAVPDLIMVFPRRQLAEILMKMITSLPMGQLTEIKLSTLQAVVKCDLFHHSDCRQVILPVLAARIDGVLSRPGASLTGAATTALGDCLDCLFAKETFGTTHEDVSTIVMVLLRTVIQCVANRDKNDRNAPAVVTNMVSLFRLMSPQHFSQYIQHFKPEDEAGRQNLLDFVMEVLLMFKDLIHNSIYPGDWSDMTMMVNSVILTALRHLSHTIRDFFSSNFEHDVWNIFFSCAISFLTQPNLQLETFSQMKRAKILARYGDMRKQMGLEIKSMWFNLGQHKIKFIPSMVGNFLEMTLIPDIDLRTATIPIFFDMMQCEFYSNSRSALAGSRSSLASLDGGMERVNVNKGNFKEFETEIIAQLDGMVMEEGRGDGMYKDKFHSILSSQCEQHMALKETGTKFVQTITRLMELLLEYRSIKQEESKDNQMSCIVNLLDFYQEHGREEMFARHLKKLYDLHVECENWSEAGFTLEKLAAMLRWTDEPLNHRLHHRSYPDCLVHRDLKIALYKDMLSHFDKGQMWEHALDKCRALATQYEEELVDYYSMAELRRKESEFYDDIMTRLRPEPEYFRVAFYGRSFPAFLQNKVFVYRGRGFERLPDFQSRLLDQFPSAELMTSLSPPTAAETDSLGQFLQINKVEPIMQAPRRLAGKVVHQQIQNYYKVNEVNQFMYSRPFKRTPDYLKNTEVENEFACLWIERTILRTSNQFPGILRWFPVVQSQVMELSPLENAIETMQNTNRELKNVVQEHMSNSPVALQPLSLKLNGIIDAAVMGGIAMYEKAFFSEEFRQAHLDDREKLVMLENLIAEQIPLLELGMKLHERKRSEDLKPLHDRLQVMFSQMKDHVEHKYGARNLGAEFRMVEARRSTGTRLCGSMAGSVARMERAQSEAADVSRMTEEDSLSVTPRSASNSTTPSTVTKSKTNLITRLGGVNRKKSRASEERVISSRNSGPLRSLTIPEHSLDNGQYASLVRSSPRLLDTTSYCSSPRPSSVSGMTLMEDSRRSGSPVTSLNYSNRDSIVSSGSNSDTGYGSSAPPPSLPPKHGIGRDTTDSQNHDSNGLGVSLIHSKTEDNSTNYANISLSSNHHKHHHHHLPPNPAPSIKKKPAPLPPVSTPPTPPKKAPLKLPLDDSQY